MIKAVFFDIDDTLFTFRAGHAAAMRAVCGFAWRKLGIPEEEFGLAYDRELQNMERQVGAQAAAHNRMIRFLRILLSYGKPVSFAPVLNELYWNTVLSAGQAEPEARTCVRSLREQGYYLGIASNMTLDWQLRKLEKIGLLPCFHRIVVSEEVGTEKPERAFFDFCIRESGFRPEECLMVGDNLDLDILGAERAGMPALWYTVPENLSRHPGFSHYRELAGKIHALQRI